MAKGSEQAKTKAEMVRQYEDRLDNILFKCMEIMKRPEKWAIDRQGNIINVYPHPIVYREARRIEGIQYLPHKSYDLPPVLLERQMYWDDLIKVKAPAIPKKKYQKRSIRKPYVKVTEEMKAKMIMLSNRGVDIKDIADKLGVSKSTVERYISINNEMIRDWAELRNVGGTAKEIANQYGVAKKSVKYFTAKQGLIEKRGYRMHTPEIIKEWARLKDNGATYREMAKAYDVVSEDLVKKYVCQYRKETKETEAVAN